MTIQWRVPPEQFMDAVEISRVTNTLKTLKIEAGKAVDSYSMSPEGPIVSSIFVLSDGYLVEILLTGKHASFDLINSYSLQNYKVIFGEHRASQVEPLVQGAPLALPEAAQAIPPKVTSFVTVNLMHTGTLHSVLSYFGDDCDNWLLYVLDVYPVSCLKQLN